MASFGPRAVRAGKLLAIALCVAGTSRLGEGGDLPATPGAKDGAWEKVSVVIEERCLSCHSGEARKAGLDLSRRVTALAGGKGGPAISPGRPDDSLLLEKVENGEMPPNGPLGAEAVAAFRGWIEAGSPYRAEPLQLRRAGPDWWSLRPIRREEPPAVRDRDWVRTPVDAFVLAGLDRAGLRPAPEADRASYIRRVTFDLIGLPPTPEETATFLADSSPGAYERLVDRLLNSPHFGERWGRHWLDVVRFAESHGYETNQLRPDAWPYRDYVIRAFNRDTPFARFVEEQLAGDQLADADGLTLSATGFLVGGAHDVVGNQAPEGALQQRADDLDDMITATSTTFLGLTVQCARCHDHKFDPILQRDYYALQAVFAGVNYAEREVPAPDAARNRVELESIEAELVRLDRTLDEGEPLARPAFGAAGRPPVDSSRNVERIEPVAARFVRMTIQSTNGLEPCIDELEVWTAGPVPRNIALASSGGKALASSSFQGSALHRLEHVNDGRVGNSRSWISGVRGKGWVQVEFPATARIDRIVWGRDRERRYQDRTPLDYYIEAAVDPGQWRVVASSADRARPGESRPEAPRSPERDRLLRRRAELLTRAASLGATMRAYAGTFTQPGPTHVLRRGDPTQKLDVVAPAGVRSVRPALALPAESPEAERRRALARWIGDPANPLPARVMVNRLWHYHFGRGLVATPSDFGFNGSRPSHPELLDCLAAEFLANGGRMKPIHRLIVLSATYRQSGRVDERAMSVDHDDRLLWRMAPRRLEAEEIRDAILAVAGTLDRRMGGPGYDLWQPNTNYVVVFAPRDRLGPDTFRRMVYQFKPRSQPDPVFGAFDCPDGGLVAPRRNVSITALQALNLLNGRFVVDQSARFAERVSREAGGETDARIRLAFRLSLGREPSDSERAAATRLVAGHGLPTLCRAMFNANEFLYVP